MTFKLEKVRRQSVGSTKSADRRFHQLIVVLNWGMLLEKMLGSLKLQLSKTVRALDVVGGAAGEQNRKGRTLGLRTGLLQDELDLLEREKLTGATCISYLLS